VRLPDVHSTWAFEIYMDWSYTNILTVDDIMSRATRISSISVQPFAYTILSGI
jgi:ABC-type arginine transport system permease subunit